jgi:transposase
MPYISDLTDNQWEVLEPLVNYIGPCRPRKYTT